MSVNSGPVMAIRTRMQIDGKTDRLGPAVALIGYARVSTGDQKLALQHDALNAAGASRPLRGHSAVLWPGDRLAGQARSEEHTSELQTLMRISYAVFCLKKKTT